VTALAAEVIGSADRPLYDKIINLPKAFEEAMDDDFNTALAIGIIYDLVRDVNKFLAEIDQKNEEAAVIILTSAQAAFDDVSGTLGIFLRAPDTWFQEARLGEHKVTLSIEEIERHIHLRNEARARKNWAEADRIRKLLDDAGVVLFDRPGGTVWKPK
jgi:cysteinyl-tRNA synthetase